MLKSQKQKKEEAEVYIPSTRLINQIKYVKQHSITQFVLAIKECRSGTSIHVLCTKSLDHHYSSALALVHMGNSH